jgi:hypothetical protein
MRAATEAGDTRPATVPERPGSCFELAPVSVAAPCPPITPLSTRPLKVARSSLRRRFNVSCPCRSLGMRKAMSASSWATTWVRVSPIGRRVMVSDSNGPSVVIQDTRSSSDSSVIRASNSRRCPSRSITQWVLSPPIGVTSATPVMKRG